MLEYITVFYENGHLSEANDQEAILESEEEQSAQDQIMLNQKTTDAIAAYRKIREGKNELTEKQQAEIDKECDTIKNRQVVEVDPIHEPKEIEITGKGKIKIGPPTLTRFEKARIMGARALQLSLGAPTFIEIPKDARTSLDIAMEELDQRVIPITIKRVLPNGDYQNIPIGYFD